MDSRSSLGRELLLLWIVGLVLAAGLLAFDVAMHGLEWKFFALLPSAEPTFLDIATAVVRQFAAQRPMAALAVVAIPAVLLAVTLTLLLAALLKRRARATA